MSSISHLAQHHGNFSDFRDAMIASTDGRFNDIWWGIWANYIHPINPQAILDLGTGPGLLLNKLRTRYPTALLTGVEVQPEMLATARVIAAENNATLLESDLAEDIPVANESIDVITAVMVLHELIYPPFMLAESARMLKPNGRMLLYDWVKRPLRDYVGTEPMTPSRLDHFREHCLFTADDISYLAESAGLRVIEYIGRRSGRFAIFVLEKPE